MILFKNCKYIFNQPPIFVKISNGVPSQRQHLGGKNATVMHLLLRRHKIIIGLFYINFLLLQLKKKRMVVTQKINELNEPAFKY
jgi:hypothetical protein